EVEKGIAGFKAMSASCIARVPVESMVMKEKVADMVPEPSGTVSSAKVTTLIPSRPTVETGVVPMYLNETVASETFCHVWNAAWAAWNSLPLLICDEPAALIQNGIGNAVHNGPCPYWFRIGTDAKDRPANASTQNAIAAAFRTVIGATFAGS